MNYRVLLPVFLSLTISPFSFASESAEKCAGILKADHVSRMGRDELVVQRERIKEQTPSAAVEAICESTAAITFAGYKSHLEQAGKEIRRAGRPDFDPAELYFFLECGDDRVNLSPLAYHAFNLNRDEYGFIGESTLAIVWMSVGYLETKDPGSGRSFMDAVDRILNYARKKESRKEIEIYEDLLLQIRGFKEDHERSVEECRSLQP